MTTHESRPNGTASEDQVGDEITSSVTPTKRAAEYVAAVTFSPGADELLPDELALAERLVSDIAETDSVPAIDALAAAARVLVDGAEEVVDIEDPSTDLEAVEAAATRRIAAMQKETARELVLLAVVGAIRFERNAEILANRMRAGGYATFGDLVAAERDVPYIGGLGDAR